MQQTRNLLIPVFMAVFGIVLAGCFELNEEPIATFTRSPASGEVPLSVFFDASHSIDTDGTIVHIAWTFGDGATAEGVTTTHTYSEAGTFEATLTVTDDRGAESTALRAITVTDAAEPPQTGTAVGEFAPAFTLKNLDGVDASLEDYRGQVVLLDFWRSTCTPCVLTMPHLESLRAEFADRGLVVIAVNLDLTEDAARAYLAANGYGDFVVLRGTLEDATAVRSLYDVDRIPHTFIIDRQGIVRYADHPIRIRGHHIEPWL